MNQINNINKELGNINAEQITVNYANSFDSNSFQELMSQMKNNNTGENVTFGDTVITVQGSADNNTVEDLKSILKQQQEEMISLIMGNAK